MACHKLFCASCPHTLPGAVCCQQIVAFRASSCSRLTLRGCAVSLSSVPVDAVCMAPDLRCGELCRHESLCTSCFLLCRVSGLGLLEVG